MSKFIKCDICNEHHWNDDFCEPIFNVYFEEYLGDEPKEIRASTHEEAALKFAECYNTENDYCLMNDTIDVKVEKSGIIERYCVGAEQDVRYTSEKIK